MFRQFLEETFDVKSHANRAIQGAAITDQLAKLAEGIGLLDKEIHSQVTYVLTNKSCHSDFIFLLIVFKTFKWTLDTDQKEECFLCTISN